MDGPTIRLKELRQDTRRSHVELARQLNIPPMYVSLIEHGRQLPWLPLLSRLALYFGCRIVEFVITEKPARSRG